MVSDNNLFTDGYDHAAPTTDSCRHAVHALRGYAYQITAAALKWLELSERATLYLEVAEDYATVLEGSLKAVQIRDTKGSTKVTLNSQAIRDAIHNFVRLTSQNTDLKVQLEYFTSSEIATERQNSGLAFPVAGLMYWRKLAKGGDITILRQWLCSDRNSQEVREFVAARSDDELRVDMLQRIHWSCGQPDYHKLKTEFSDCLVRTGREVFNLSSQFCEKIESMILFHVLQTSLRADPNERALNRTMLYRFIDNASRVSVSWQTFENALNGFNKNTGLNPAPDLPGWISKVYEVSDDDGLVPRTQLIKEAQDKLASTGACIIFGSSGLGKSHVSRNLASPSDFPLQVIDFRDVEGAEAISRITVLMSNLGFMNTQLIILEDLNCLQDPRVASHAVGLFSAFDRRDMKFILTCYEAPTNRTLLKAGIPKSSVMACRYLTQDETNLLVELHGGNPALWGNIAHASGDFGHPQLVHAFITGMAARDWPTPEIVEVLKKGMSSDDVRDERESVRRYVIRGLPEPAREMLFRLSLINGNFTRDAATNLGATPPPLHLPGELFDILKGPWIESLGNNYFRISPLAAKSGKDVLTPAAQTALHSDIASHFFKGGRGIDLQDIEKIIIHAMAGKNEFVLTVLSMNLLTADEEIIRYLDNNVSLLRMLPLRGPVWPDNTVVSCALRIIQFKIKLLSRDSRQIQACWEALKPELKCVYDNESSRPFHAAGLAAVLNTLGIATYLDNWVDLLIEYHSLIEHPSYSDMFDEFGSEQLAQSDVVPMFFAVGVTGLSDINVLERIIQYLNKLAPEMKIYLLSFYQKLNPDFSVLVQTAWTEKFVIEKGPDIVKAYRDLARSTTHWNLPALTTQCWIASSIVASEKLRDTPAALSILEHALAENADPKMVCLARIKILWQNGEHARVCEDMISLAGDAHLNNPVERVYLLRHAAISASKVQNWDLAERWFLMSQQVAHSIEMDNMQTMAAGLTADAAVTSFKAGNIKRSLKLIASALDELENIDHESSLNAYYCHQVVRHVVLWMQLMMEGEEVASQQSIIVVPGCCSNPTPLEAITQKKHTPVMLAWYMLAEMDIAAGAQLHLINKITPRSENQYVLILEFALRNRLLMQSMLNLDETGFAEAAYDFIPCWIKLQTLRDSGRLGSDHENMVWESIPLLTQDVTATEITILDKLLISYFIVAACKNRPANLDALKQSITDRFGQTATEASLFSRLEKRTGHDQQMLISLAYIGQGSMRTPMHFCLAGIHALLQAWQSYNRKELIPLIAQWQRMMWETFIRKYKLNAPGVFSVLNRRKNDEVFLSKLLVETAKITQISLSDKDIRELTGMNLK